MQCYKHSLGTTCLQNLNLEGSYPIAQVALQIGNAVPPKLGEVIGKSIIKHLKFIMTSLKFSIANNAVTHLGRNLYSTTPPALANLVANSYDAYATAVNINLSNESISIIDNGRD